MSEGHQKVTCLAFLGYFGEGGGLEVLEEGGGLFSRVGWDEGNIFDTTGWFFFPDGSSAGPSAGRLIPPMPPTADTRRQCGWGATPGEGRAAAILTGGTSVEVVVILGDIRQDAEAVGDLKSHHVFCVQQGRNSQLLLRNPEGLGIRKTHIRPRG